MKKLLLIALLIPALGFSQTVYTSTQAGNFLTPSTWSPFGVPMSGDSVYINHAVVMNSNIYYTAGRITINAGGSLIEDATDRSFWADGTGSLVNMGTFTVHLLLASPNTAITNVGLMDGLDSVWNQSSMLMNTGTMNVYDLLNDQTATFHNHSSLNVANNFNNQGFFHMNGDGQTDVANDFSNCNTQTMNAHCENHGTMCIGNDFSNCAGDSLDGSGNYFVAGQSANLGEFVGTFTFHTPTGSLNLNTGTVEPGVTITTGACDLSIAEEQTMVFKAFPNPTMDNIYVTLDGVEYQLIDCTGKVIREGKVKESMIKMDDLRKGLYLLKVDGQPTIRVIRK